MGALIDLTGERFGRLTVLRRVENDGRGVRWECVCDCGNKKVAHSHELRYGKTRSCGCLLHESRVMNGKNQAVHGGWKSRLYGVWAGMKKRCYYEKHPQYHNYGGRGINVCNDWLHDFGKFSEWAYSHGYDENAKKGGCTLDRVDSDGNYEPSNCRWVNQKTQISNKRPGTHGAPRQVIRIDTDGNEVMFESISDALKALGRSRGNSTDVVKCCQGIRKSAVDYKWRFA